jgi:hypothetical protein
MEEAARAGTGVTSAPRSRQNDRQRHRILVLMGIDSFTKMFV